MARYFETTTLVAEAYDGDNGIQIYDGVKAGVSVRIADHLTVARRSSGARLQSPTGSHPGHL